MGNHVQDDETLYRCIFFDRQGFTFIESEGLIVTRSAFLDPNNQPSVDRAKLCNNDPRYTQGDDERNGVVSLIAKEVRAIDDVKKYNNPPVTYAIDVVPVPLNNNPAHAEIHANPQIASKSVFRRLKTSLAILANKRGWLIFPEGFRNGE